MYNYVLVMGVLDRVEEVEKGHSVLVLECSRQYQDASGHYAKDSIPVHVYEPLTSNLFDNLKVRSSIITKGRLEVENGTLIIIAERIMFLEQNKSE